MPSQYRILKVTLAALGCLILALIAFFLLVLRPQTIAHRKAVRTAGSLRDLAFAMESYADKHDGAFPAPSELVLPGTHAGPVKPYGRWHRPAAWPLLARQQAVFLEPFLSSCFPTATSFRDRLTDAWGRPILCAVTADHRSYTLMSLGPHGVQETEPLYRWDLRHGSGNLVISDYEFLSLPVGVDSGGANGFETTR